MLFTVKRYGAGLLASEGAVAVMRALRIVFCGFEHSSISISGGFMRLVYNKRGSKTHDDLGVPGAEKAVLVLGSICQGGIASLCERYLCKHIFSAIGVHAKWYSGEGLAQRELITE